MHNTPLDLMYIDLFIFAMVSMITVRTWELMLLVHQNKIILERKSRMYTYMFYNTLSLCGALAVFVVPYLQFGTGQSIDLLNQLIGPFRICGWIIVVVHVVFVPFFGYMAYWLWRRRDRAV